MSFQRAHKRLGKHPVHLGRRHCPRVLSCACERMQRWIEIALDWVRGGRGGREVVVEGPGDDFDLHDVGRSGALDGSTVYALFLPV